jgi:hypothetical protein
MPAPLERPEHRRAESRSLREQAHQLQGRPGKGGRATYPDSRKEHASGFDSPSENQSGPDNQTWCAHSSHHNKPRRRRRPAAHISPSLIFCGRDEGACAIEARVFAGAGGLDLRGFILNKATTGRTLPLRLRLNSEGLMPNSLGRGRRNMV